MTQSNLSWDELRPGRGNYQVQVRGNLLHHYEMLNSSAEKQKSRKYFEPQYVQDMLEDLVSTLPPVLSRQFPCDFGLGVPCGGNTLNAPGAYPRNSRYGEYYHVSSCTLKHSCACHIRRQFLQVVFANCCIPIKLQKCGFSQELLVEISNEIESKVLKRCQMRSSPERWKNTPRLSRKLKWLWLEKVKVCDFWSMMFMEYYSQVQLASSFLILTKYNRA